MCSNLICLVHPEYDGSHAPELSCKACCYIYLEKIKEKNAKKFNPKKWIQDKKEELKNKNIKANNSAYFDPSLV